MSYQSHIVLGGHQGTRDIRGPAGGKVKLAAILTLQQGFSALIDLFRPVDYFSSNT